MLTNSIPKIGAEMETRITELETVIGELDTLNVDRTGLVNLKRKIAEAASNYIVQARAVVKEIFGEDSSEYVDDSRFFTVGCR
ncbi:hypothetical protein [Candidatus Electronema sp. PJ]|uniref:hypothetical protein n=1 Tax=Candidatus Electronema sp. PJ TaxID=3401572 RepID=UPI003AA9545D